MTQVLFSRKRGQAPALDHDALQAVERRAGDEADVGAATDRDNPPVDAERLARMVVAREVRRIREGVQLSQAQFAATYRIGLGRLRDWEQGRSSPDLPLLAFLRMVDEAPQKAAQTVAEVETLFDAA